MFSLLFVTDHISHNRAYFYYTALQFDNNIESSIPKESMRILPEVREFGAIHHDRLQFLFVQTFEDIDATVEFW
jgi:hypothetical protein